MPVDQLKQFLVTGLSAVFIGGLLSVLLSPALGFFTGPIGGLVLAALLVVAIVYVAKYADADQFTFLEWLVLLFVVAAIGNVVVAFVPAAAGFILSTSSITLSGLVFTALWILAGDAVYDKFVGS